ncbi:MAG: class I SAM-dependent methyltransferase [Halobacteriovoraceae bacterium]|nr:class I SAM-dependent methyltransferase [Halobacteriovoraceae bacterium]
MSKEQEKMQQEDFLIELEQRKKIVRQDRFECSDKNYQIEINGKIFKVIDFSYFSISFLSPEDCEIGKELSDIRFSDGENEINPFHGHVMRTQLIDSHNYKVAIGFDHNMFPVEAILAQEKMISLLGKHRKYLEKILMMPPEFRAAVFEVKSTLQHLKEMVIRLEEEQFFYSQEQQNTFQKATSNKLMTYLDEYFTPLLESLVYFTENLDDKTLNASYDFFRQELKDILYLSPFAHRSYYKPLGYAGDFEMMNILYRNEAVGPNLFGKALNQYFVNHSNAKAVRNRSQYLKKFLTSAIEKRKNQNRITILCVASGPAREIRLLLESLPKELSKKLEVNLLDQDLISLKYAQRENNNFLKETNHQTKFFYHNLTIKNIIIDGLSDSYDIIYSAGLFDYFTDAVAKKAASQMYKALNPNGTLNIGNFCIRGSSAIQMIYVLDWNLIYRNEKQLIELYNGICSEVSVEEEEEGVNLFAVFPKGK